MSATIGDRLNRLKIIANIVAPMVKFEDKLLIHFIEMSRDQVWRTIARTSEFIVRKTVTVDSNDDLPVDYVSYANSAMYQDGDDVWRPFTYADVHEIGTLKTNDLTKAGAINPILWFSDNKIRTEPDNLENIEFEYIARPQTFVGEELDTEDNMPEYTEPIIVRGAFERVLQQVLEEADSLKLTQSQLAEVMEANAKYYQGYYNNQLEKAGV
jgi:biotin carboxylase